MIPKWYKRLFISVFFAFICFINLMMVITPHTTEADYEYRELTLFPPFNVKSFLSTEYQQKFESAYGDQFFQRGFFVKWNTRMEYLVTKYFAYFNDTEDNFIPLRDVKKYNDHYTDGPIRYDDEKMSKLIQHVNMYNEIDNLIEQPVYIYKNLLLNEVDFINNKSYTEGSKKYRDTFESLLNDTIHYEEMKIKDYQEYSRYFYKTDLHHTAAGAYKAYSDMINMLNDQFPQIGNPRQIVEDFCIPDVEYRGSYARKTAFYSHDIDYICDYSLSYLTPYIKTIIDGEEKRNGEKVAYQDGYGPGYNTIHHYDAYYGGYAGEIKYDFRDNTGLNALFLVDSFSNPLNDWFASHFDNTFVIDLRLNKDFVLSEFLEQNEIDVIVVYLYYDRLFFSDEYLINLD